jgi:hypothetical protein
VGREEAVPDVPAEDRELPVPVPDLRMMEPWQTAIDRQRTRTLFLVKQTGGNSDVIFLVAIPHPVSSIAICSVLGPSGCRGGAPVCRTRALRAANTGSTRCRSQNWNSVHL